MGLQRDEAARRIKRTDEARVRYQQHYFNAHMYDCTLYDLVLNTEVLGCRPRSRWRTARCARCCPATRRDVGGKRGEVHVGRMRGRRAGRRIVGP